MTSNRSLPIRTPNWKGGAISSANSPENELIINIKCYQSDCDPDLDLDRSLSDEIDNSDEDDETYFKTGGATLGFTIA